MPEFIRNHMPWVALFISAVGVAWTIVLALLSKTYVKRDEFDEIKSRLVNVELQISALPTKEQMHQIELKVSEVGGDVKAIKSYMDSMRHTTQMLVENELEKR
jgi:hypothetical protein